MAVGEFYVEHQNWARFPKVVHVCRKRGYGGIERKRYVPERTCHNTEYLDGCFACSACGEELEDPRQEPNFVKWCPFCGAKVIDKAVD